MFTLSVGGTGCPLRIPFATIAPAPVEIFRRMPPRKTFTTFTTVTVVLGLALPYPALSLRCRYQAELLRAREQPLAILDTATGEVVRMTLKHEGNNVRRPDGSPLGPGQWQGPKPPLHADRQYRQC